MNATPGSLGSADHASGERPGVLATSTTSSPLTTTYSIPSGTGAARRRWRSSAPGPGRRPPGRRRTRRAAAAVGQPQAGRRGAGHLADGLFEAEERLVAHELAEDAREGAVRARRRLVAEERGVGADHPDRMARRSGGASRSTDRCVTWATPRSSVEQEVADGVDRVAAASPPSPRPACGPPSAGSRAG